MNITLLKSIVLKFNSKGRKSLLLTSHSGRSTDQAELKRRLQHGERRHGARLQVLQDGLRRGPLPRVGVAARQAQQQQPLGLLLVVRAAQAQVDGLQHAPGTVEPPHPLQQLAAPGRVAAGDTAAADDLQDHGAEAEDVGLAGGAPCVEALERRRQRRPAAGARGRPAVGARRAGTGPSGGRSGSRPRSVREERAGMVQCGGGSGGRQRSAGAERRRALLDWGISARVSACDLGLGTC